jgi:hypothetical protein
MSESQTLYQYRLHCNSEDALVYTWDTQPPIVCPNNNSHQIDIASISIIDTVATNNISIIQTTGDIQENYCCESKKITIPANTTMSNVYTWPINIAILTVNWTSEEIHRGDIIDGYIAKNTTIGVNTSPVSQGDTVIHVSPTVIEYINRGYIVNITDGISSINLGQCININKSASTITCEIPAITNMNPWSYIRMTIHNIRSMIIDVPGKYVLATKHLQASSLPKTTEVEVVYTNNSNIEKSFIFFMEFMY